MKGIAYADLVAMRDKRRDERRKEHKDRPKTKYKGLTWFSPKYGKPCWHVQVWTGKTVSSLSTPSNLPLHGKAHDLNIAIEHLCCSISEALKDA